MTESENTATHYFEEVDALVVGAGFSGMYMLHSLLALDLNVIVVDEANGVGGTWYWNRYPGARCDVESMEYSYSFSSELQQEWNWKDRYSTQTQILEYANHVADRFNLRKHIRFNSRLNSARYDEENNRWSIVTSNGITYSARFLIMATGTLSSINRPTFEGLDDFTGEWYMTGKWPHEPVSFSGKRVGIIGTGSSAVQTIPIIAKEARHLTVFQRTANYSIPASNRPLEEEEVREIKANYDSVRSRAKKNPTGIASRSMQDISAMEVSEEERNREYEKRWNDGGTNFMVAYNDIGVNAESNETAAEFVRSKIREIVKDQNTASLLSPTNAIGCKRLCADTNYYSAFNRSNVELIDVNETPIQRITKNGIETSSKAYDLDAIVFAIGFDAMTGALLAMDIVGRSQTHLRDKWSDGPSSFLGLCIEGFPNMFTITWPGSPSVLSNMMTSIEQHVEWIRDCIEYMTKEDKIEIEAQIDAERQWMDHVEDIASNTLRYSCNSWYLGDNVPGKKRVFMPYAGGIPKYRAFCDAVADSEYKDFSIK